ncbi:hypothetical protein C7818_12420 [Leuconostoc mesenteroides]|uniref:hypothetical protein n=1 Tax=Leuconostoc mesenteroides TaxID=1245 RepID=UPI001065D49E|nr:hypothetical protein [Leuconostoc mesenteroides]TDV87557.1 hypothetical protein C7818_12420 [Leuconostoc mesenteroides]
MSQNYQEECKPIFFDICNAFLKLIFLMIIIKNSLIYLLLSKVGIIDELDDDLFMGLVDVIEVWHDKKVVRFKDGSEVEV